MLLDSLVAWSDGRNAALDTLNLSRYLFQP